MEISWIQGLRYIPYFRIITSLRLPILYIKRGITTMYAVIFSGGKQYRVKEGQSVRLEKLDVTAGDSIEFDKVLMVADGDNIKVGAPYLSGITVKAEVLRQGRGDKIFIIKMKRRKHYMRRTGHRQDFTEVKITGIAA